jgi:plastocyanin
MTEHTDGLSRRTFVSIAAVSAAAPALAGCTGDNGESGEEPADGGDESGGDDGSGDESGGSDNEVIVGPDGDFAFSPEELTVDAGTTVTFVWDSDTHNVVPTSQPDDADWAGEEEIKNSGHEYEHTFEVAGTYEYVCEPHEASGMAGTIVVE